MSTTPDLTAPGKEKRSSVKVARLVAAIATVRQRYNVALGAQAGFAATPWAASAGESLLRAEKLAGQDRVDVDGAWGSVHDAERLMVYGLSDRDLLVAAVGVEAEARAKLASWRASAMLTLFASVDADNLLKTHATLTPAQQESLRSVVIQAMRTLHEESDNRYHRLRLVARQLEFLVWVLLPLMVVVLALCYFYGTGAFAIDLVASVMIAGAIGGVVSAMFQLSRVGEAKIPEALMQGVITSGRPVVAAASALFIYAALAGNVISILSGPTTKEGLIVFAFVAGFSEQLVLGAVAKVVGAASDKKATAKEKRGE